MKIIYTFCAILLFFEVYGQENYISSENFPIVYNRFLTSTISGNNEVSTLGSYVSVDITKPNANIGLSINHKNKNGYITNISSINVKGGINEGATKLFENEKFSSDASFKIEHSFLFPTLKYIQDYKEELKKKKSNINLKKVKTIALIEALKRKIKDYENSKNEDEVFDEENYLQLGLKLIQLEKSIEDEIFKEEEKKVELSAKWSMVRVCWINLFGEYGVNGVSTYDNNRPLSEIIKKQNPETYNVGFGFNIFYNQASDLPRSVEGYWANILNGIYSFNYSFGRTNNLVELSPDNFVFNKVIASNENENLIQSTTSKAYNESKFESFTQHQLSIDINKKIINNLFFHLSYEYNMFEDSDTFKGNYQNLSSGIIFSIKKKGDKEQKAFLNIEPFIQFRDITNKFDSENEDEFYKRSFIGIRTSIPFGNLMSKS